MTDNVVEFNGVTRLDLPPGRVLQRADAAGLTKVLVLGYDADGDFFFASSSPDGGDVLWLLELARIRLMALAESMAE